MLEIKSKSQYEELIKNKVGYIVSLKNHLNENSIHRVSCPQMDSCNFEKTDHYHWTPSLRKAKDSYLLVDCEVCKPFLSNEKERKETR